MNATALVDDVEQEAEWPCGVPPLQDFASKVSAADVKVSAADAQFMDDVVASVHRAIATSFFQETTLASAPPIARVAQGVRGMFSGFDFHLTAAGPKLIEINTNAGGAFYGALIDDARHEKGEVDAKPFGHWARLFVQHFRNEWALAGRGPLRTAAIVDDMPNEQFLRLEFHLAARMLHEAGIAVVIADPRELTFESGRLLYGSTPIDLVYNRLTSFALDRDVDWPLREALIARAVVVTPDPRTHALLACKRNLARLGDEAFLQDAGVDSHARDVLLRAVPKTVSLSPENAAGLWAERDRFYFKPQSGFGSRAVYDGEKLTAKTWREILAAGGYVAQETAEPRRVNVPGGPPMRFDVRVFAYGDAPFMRLARVYRGQTTNFRTPGGGFAPVRVEPMATKLDLPQ